MKKTLLDYNIVQNEFILSCWFTNLKAILCYFTQDTYSEEFYKNFGVFSYKYNKIQDQPLITVPSLYKFIDYQILFQQNPLEYVNRKGISSTFLNDFTLIKDNLRFGTKVYTIPVDVFYFPANENYRLRHANHIILALDIVNYNHILLFDNGVLMEMNTDQLEEIYKLSRPHCSLSTRIELNKIGEFKRGPMMKYDDHKLSTSFFLENLAHHNYNSNGNLNTLSPIVSDLDHILSHDIGSQKQLFMAFVKCLHAIYILKHSESLLWKEINKDIFREIHSLVQLINQLKASALKITMKMKLGYVKDSPWQCIGFEPITAQEKVCGNLITHFLRIESDYRK